MSDDDYYVREGDTVEVTKTVSETDVYLFAGITGDFSTNHVNEEVMSRSRFGRRVAHGALMVGFMSAASTRMIETLPKERLASVTSVSLGYDRVRFIAPVYLGDTIRVLYKIIRIDRERDRSYAKIEIFNQAGEIVAASEHILKWIRN